MGKASVATGATVSGSPHAADLGAPVTVGQLARILGQLGFPATLTGAAGAAGPSVSLASTSTDLTGTFVRADVAVTGKLLTTGGLGVGNSASGSTPGTCVKKIQVFDAAGTSLGYVAVYDAIT